MRTFKLFDNDGNSYDVTTKNDLFFYAVEGLGFKQATEAWGGELPEISQKTYDAVMSKFDTWAAEANGSTAVEGEV